MDRGSVPFYSYDGFGVLRCVRIFNFMIRSGLMRKKKKTSYFIKSNTCFTGEGQKVQMDHVANSAKWPNQCSMAYLKATSLKVETDLSI